MSKTTSLLSALLCTFIWGTTFIAQDTGMDNIGPFTFNAVRFFIGFLAITPLVFLFELKKYKSEFKSDIKTFSNKRYKTKNTHGTGCTLSSAITTFLSCGKPIKKSCELGINYVSSGIRTNPKYGKGHGPINHLNSINLERKFR